MPTTDNYNPVGGHTWNTEREVGELLASLIICTGAKRVLECGVFHGYTSLQLIDALPKGGYYAGIDIEDLRVVKSSVTNKAIDFIVGSSTNEAIYPEGKFDLIFVDSMHYWDHILPEWKIVETKIADGGLICYHDTQHILDVAKLMDYIKRFKYDVVTMPTPDNRGLTIIKKAI